MSDPVKHLVLWRAIRDYPMPPRERAILMSLCAYGDENGKNIWPGKQTLASLNEMSLQGIAKIYQQLKEKGYLIEDGWHNRRKKWCINTKLFLDAAKPKKEVKAKREKPAAPAPPVPEKPKPVVVAPPVVEVPPPLTPEQIEKRKADTAKVLEKLRR